MVDEKANFPYRVEAWDDRSRVTTPAPAVVEAIKRIADKVVISGHQLEMLLLNAVDVSYWRNLNPQLTVAFGATTATTVRNDTVYVSKDQQSKALDHLLAHGYFALPPLCAPELISRMRASVYTLRGAGWPAVFVFIYDEFWKVFQSNTMVGFLREYLGDYKVTGNIWAHYVEPKAWASGWPPHIDSGIDPKWLTVWIPLTDASIDNGCIYVIPRDLVPQSLPQNYTDWRRLDVAELAVLLHSVRPLPAKPGSLLGWNHQLIHWGGRASTSATKPRISLALEFVAETVVPGKAGRLVAGPGSLPDFPTRLGLIAEALIKYKNFETQLRRYDPLARSLIKWSMQPSGLASDRS